MALAQAAIKSARVYLNDVNGITWADSILMPILQEAHGELIQELEKFNLSVILNQTATVTVSAGDLTLGLNQPETLVEPISLSERFPGDDNENFEPMIRTTFIPQEDQSDELIYWSWLGQIITFLGATSDREVLLRYKGSLVTPQKLTDPLGFIFAERFLGPRIASIAKDSIGGDGSKFQTLAEAQLYKIVQSNVTNDQRPVRHRGYRSIKLGFTGNVISTSRSGSGTINVNQWVLTLTPPDGIRTTFSFSRVPKFISWNGINQNKNQGYLIYAVPGNVLITFTDVLGNVLVPANTDIIIGVNGSQQNPPITNPDGVTTVFVFAKSPQYITWNGLNQFLGVGYTEVPVTTTLVSFIDNLGLVLTPGPQDDIREAV